MEVAKSSQNGTLTCMHPLYIECCFRTEGYIFLVLLIQINSSNKIVHTVIMFMFRLVKKKANIITKIILAVLLRGIQTYLLVK